MPQKCLVYVAQLTKLNIVWLKRDLRLTDHEPLKAALQQGLPVLLWYAFEPTVLNAADTSPRHWQFVWQSLVDMEKKLSSISTQILITYGECVPFLEQLKKQVTISGIYAHQEIGNAITFERDKQVTRFCKENGITFLEYQRDGVIRGLKHRKTWNTDWKTTMEQPLQQPNWDLLIKPADQLYHQFDAREKLPAYVKEKYQQFQPGGFFAAQKYLETFLQERAANYMKHISKPELSRKSCSRLSPYLAYGNLSMREVYQASLTAKWHKRNIQFFIARLHWHCHFIQKFESECRMETENLNAAFNSIRTEWNQTYFDAWAQGKTGYPLVDACMRCLHQTGYINFRMRAMLVSFLTHNLWLHWKQGALHLARLFLDYEPGIHYPQIQMQAGCMGVNTSRTYNPIKQSLDHDTEGTFIKRWIPELKNLPSKQIHEPWLLTEQEQQEFSCVLGVDYPLPVIDWKTSAKAASEQLWKTKKSTESKTENTRILAKHVVARKKSIPPKSTIKTIQNKQMGLFE